MSVSPTRTPCRLFVILARNAPRGVIFRRGPSEWVQLIAWDTATDTFQSGQWFHGRIYKKRCDLSPNGGKLVYFAARPYGPTRTVGESYYNTWTAISKPPYLTALALWPGNESTYCGGGLFDADNRVVINAYAGRITAHPNHRPPFRLKVIAKQLSYGDELTSMRLVRDGWTFDRNVSPASKPKNNLGVRCKTRKKEGLALLATTTDGKIGEHDQYEVIDLKAGRRTLLKDVRWADWDQQGRFVFTRNGCVFSARYGESGRLEVVQLADFNGATFAALEAPDEAKVW